jgi:hypothetical protein
MRAMHRVHILFHRPGDQKTQRILMRKNPEPLTRALHILLQGCSLFFPITLRSLGLLLYNFRRTFQQRKFQLCTCEYLGQ